MKLGEYNEALQFIADYKDDAVKQRLLTYYQMMKDGEFGEIQEEEEEEEEESKNGLIKILDLLNNGYIYYLKSGDIENAYRSFRSAIDLLKNNREKVLLCETVKGMLGIYDRFSKTVREESYIYFIDLHKKNAYDPYEKEFNSLFDYRVKLRYFSGENESIEEIKMKKRESNKLISGSFADISTKLHLTNSSFYLKDSIRRDSSIYFIDLAKRSNLVREDYFASEDAISLKIHESILLHKQGETTMALKNLEGLVIQANNGFIFQLLILYRQYWLFELSKDIIGGEADHLRYKQQYEEADLSLRDIENRETVVDMEVNTQVSELKIEMKNRQFEYITFGVFLVLITLFLLNNSRKKRLIAVQEKELEIQKNLTLLKEQEIGIINAMIEGQEKERQQVAEDLHDNLGSAIATLKLHFENLKLSLSKKKIDKEALFTKTEDLIEEAYQKVRSIAHVKNSGVIANKGLLVAIQLMAQKVSAANSIDIEVVHFGLEKHLENSLEISLFRMVQELTTNIIKHASASHATINITQDKQGITLLVEDNGVGMDTSKITTTHGMGLHSIETRVEHLGGQFTIDSTPTKGTTIIIQIPS